MLRSPSACDQSYKATADPASVPNPARAPSKAKEKRGGDSGRGSQLRPLDAPRCQGCQGSTESTWPGGRYSKVRPRFPGGTVPFSLRENRDGPQVVFPRIPRHRRSSGRPPSKGSAEESLPDSYDLVPRLCLGTRCAAGSACPSEDPIGGLLSRARSSPACSKIR